VRHPWTAAFGLAVLAAVAAGHYSLYGAPAPGPTPAAALSAPAPAQACETPCATPCEPQAATSSEATAPTAPTGYWRSGRGFLGLSYGTAFGFLAYVVAHAVAVRRRGAGGAGGAASGVAGPLFGGATLAGGLWLAICWLVGCCGSPLLPVYVSLFGARFLGFTGPIVFGVTAVSVAVGALWYNRACERGCACAAAAPEAAEADRATQATGEA